MLSATASLPAGFSRAGSGAAVVLSSYLQLSSPGLYDVQIDVAAPSTSALGIVLLMGGQRVPLTDLGSGAFQVASSGAECRHESSLAATALAFVASTVKGMPQGR